MWNVCNCVGRNTLILIALCTANFITGSSSKYENRKGWLKLCNNNNVLNYYEVEAETCPHGAWLPKNFYGRCICINGVWAISQSWCDEDYIVAYGKGHCFKLEMPIRKLTYLGNPQSAFEPTNFVTTGNGHVFRSFSNEFTMPRDFSRDANHTILRLRPIKGTGIILNVKRKATWVEEYVEMKLETDGMMLNGQPICLHTDLRNGWEENALMIYKVKTGMTQIKVTKQCQKPLYHYNELDDSYNRDKFVTDFKVLPGQAIHVKSGSIFSATQNCSLTCPSRLSNLFKPIRQKRQATDVLELDRVLTPEDKDEIVKTANLRVAKHELNWLLEGTPPPRLRTQNWKLFQKIREIFLKVCPSKEAPRFLVDAMIRLFRLFYLNSREFFPNGYMMEEKAQINRMSATLGVCLKEATQLEFNYEVVSNETACRKDMRYENATLCPCTEQLATVNVSYATNATGPPETRTVFGSDLQLSENLTFLVPNENDTNPDSTFHDFPTETMWKVIIFTHFYCAKYFKRNPADFSALISKMENFFNEDILFRWTRPGKSSFKILQYLYTSFNLKKFAKSVDACVAVSKMVSVYPEWLNRPTLDNNRRRKRSIHNGKLLENSAYCMDDPTNPVYNFGVGAQDKCIDLNTQKY